MNRRHLLTTGATAIISHAVDAAANEPWRTFELTTRVEIRNSVGATRIWLPAPLTASVPWQRTLSTRLTAQGATIRRFDKSADGLRIHSIEFPPGAKPLVIHTAIIATRDRLAAAPSDLTSEARAHFLRPTRLLPTDGIVRATALEITRVAKTDLDKARAIYDWIVDNTSRNPKTQGCGLGDIRFMLESRDLSGKCADLNALYVGLARAAGLPARDVYGIRVAKSRSANSTLGINSATATKAQHCRAEVYVQGHGWLPVDPADVRKVALEEPASHVAPARTRLCGSWEMNWIAWNFAHDIALPGSTRPPLPFLMYPQAETAEGRPNSLDPESFTYQITVSTA